MAGRSRARGGVAVFGLLLVLAGIAGGAVLYMLSVQRPSQAVEGFGRAPIGCTTTLEFTETGTFYVFEERGLAVDVPGGGCQPLADPARAFGFELRGPDGPVVVRPETSIVYDTDEYAGTSVARVEIAAVGRYEIVAVGDDAQVVAAIGRNPDDGVTELRQLAIVVAGIGVLLGALVLLLSGRRSRRAAGPAPVDAPVWSWQPHDGGISADPAAGDRRVASLPVHAPVAPEQAPLLAGQPAPDEMLERRPGEAAVSPWAPPTPDQAAIAPPESPAVGGPADADELRGGASR